MAKNRKRRGRGRRGEGSIFFDDKRQLWVGSLFVGVNPDTKKVRRKVVYGKTQKEVQDKLLEQRNRLKLGVQQESEQTLKTFLLFWLDCTIKLRAEANTYKSYRQLADDYLVPHLGHIPINQLTHYLIGQFYRELEEKGTSACLRRATGRLLRQALSYAHNHGFLNRNVAKLLPLPRADPEEMHPLDEAQVKRFLAAAEGHRLYEMFLMALDTGMRQGELIALEWSDIDFEAGTVTVSKSAQRVRLPKEKGEGKGKTEWVRIKDVKTKAGRRRIRLTQRTLDALRARKERSKGTIVFPSRSGTYLYRNNVWKSFVLVLQRAGLPAIRFHDLRHTHATLSLLRTKNIKAISCRLGHSKIQTTLQTYAHYLPAMEEDIVSAMEDILAPEAGWQPGAGPRWYGGRPRLKRSSAAQGDGPAAPKDGAEVAMEQTGPTATLMLQTPEEL